MTDPVAAFCFDRAVWLFGSHLQGELEKAKGKTEAEIERSREKIVNKWIPEAATKNGKRKRFRDPATER